MMDKIKLCFVILSSFGLLSCASNNLYLKNNSQNNSIQLTIKNNTKDNLHIPKFYLETIDQEICNNQFEILSNNGEEAWFSGIFYSVNIPDYETSPDRYIVLKKNESVRLEITSIKNQYSFENDYDYFFVRYNGYLGKSNKLKIVAKLIPVKK